METSDDESEMTPLKRIKKNPNLFVAAITTKKTFTKESVKPRTSLKKGKENTVNQKIKRKTKSNLERSTSNPIDFFSPSKRFSSLNNTSAGPFISITQPPLLSMKYGNCPVCIIDLNFIHGTTPQAHINKCLDLDPKFENGFCPGGSTCLLSNEFHFRQYKHYTVEKLDVKMNVREDSHDSFKSHDSVDVQMNVKEDSHDSLKSHDSVESAFEDYETEIESKEVATSEEVLEGKIVVGEKSVNSHKMNQSKISNFFRSTRPRECSIRKESSSANQTNGKSEKLLVEKKPSDMIDKLNGYEMKKEAKPKTQNRRKECPFYKKIPGTGITVDAFRYGDVVDCTCYFLSHFHSDHYGGLSKHFQGKLYCSKITGNLVISELNVQSSCVVTLPMNQAVEIEDFKVTLLDANHCPGSVMFLFELSNNQRILHVGDFRADVSMLDYASLTSKRLNVIYLDTTYCNPRYCFPPQHMTIELVKVIVEQFLEKNPRTLIVVGTYTIGKERVFQAIVDSLNLDKIAVSKNKLRVLKCLEDPLLSSKLTLDYNAAQLHILPMMHLTVAKLQQHLASHNVNGRYDHVLAFKPTGWTFSGKMTSLDNLKPTVRGAVTLYGIPYSEHSSFDELKWFISKLKPLKIIPTVNIGSKDSRDQMEKHFNEWLTI